MNEIIKIDDVKSKIYTIRGKQVMLDRDLAELYGVETRRINEQVKRNIERFDDDFMFQLTNEEFENLKSHFATSSWGGVRKLPYAFSEQGVYMLATVLKSKTAIEVTKQIMRTFTKMREFLSNNNLMFERFERIETRLSIHDKQINKLFDALQTKKATQGIFHNGQIYDAYAFINDLLKSAKKEVILIDNYIDDSILTLFSKYDVKYTIIT
ncbi:MAG: ORF6N domain-containing protein, partial [Epsilonproteobacteria bacterium]|nr:ORF6N domain-containing protein [Campylobacterota bacterium]